MPLNILSKFMFLYMSFISAQRFAAHWQHLLVVPQDLMSSLSSAVYSSTEDLNNVKSPIKDNQTILFIVRSLYPRTRTKLKPYFQPGSRSLSV